MKFRFSVILSLIFHFSLVAIAFFSPEKMNKNSTTYYVDLVHLNGGPAGGGNKLKSDISQNKIKATMLEEEKGKVKNLTVKKEVESKLRYPDKKIKKEKKKVEKKELITVVRKKRKTNYDKVKKNTVSSEESGFIKTGLSGSGTGDGSGMGGGIGGNFPYAYYVETLKNKISSSWYNPLTSSGVRGRFNSVVYFRIFRNGSIGTLKFVEKSGNISYDLSTMRVIREVTPFPPLPSDYPELYLGVYFEFEWEK